MARLSLPLGYHDVPEGRLVNLVTCLEMPRHPRRKALPLPAGFSLMRFGARDAAAFRKLFRAVGENHLWFSRLEMKPAELRAVLANPNIESFALMKRGKAVGLLELDFTIAGECELSFLGVVPECVGQGLGRALLGEAVRRAFLRPIDRFWVHTCSFDHPSALPFYQKGGFKPYKLMVEIHDDPRLNGKLPLSAAPHVPLLRKPK